MMIRSIQSCIPRLVQVLRESCFLNDLIGIFRRMYLVYLRREYVKRQLGLRKGECHQCGECCSFLFACPMLTQQRLCRIYKKTRPGVCKLFPLDQRDIDEVAL